MLFLKVVADYTPGKNTFQHLFSVYVVLFFLIAFPPDTVLCHGWDKLRSASRHPWALPPLPSRHPWALHRNDPRIQEKKALL
jgi:hypothetical protein